MKVIGYIRVSTDGQEQSGLGLEDQEAKVRAYCSLYDLELVTIHRDAASGKNLRRPGLQAALAAMKAGQAEGIVVAKLDRLTRSVKDMGTLLDSYFREAFAFHSVGEQINTTTAAGRLVLNVLTSVAEWERETISERTSAAMAVKRKRKEYTGGHVPFGFQDMDGKLVAVPAEQTALQRINDLRSHGYSYNRIASALNAEGIPAKNGGAWHPFAVQRIYQRAA